MYGSNTTVGGKYSRTTGVSINVFNFLIFLSIVINANYGVPQNLKNLQGKTEFLKKIAPS